MPLHLAAATRRQFLVQSAAALGSFTLLRTGWGAEGNVTPHRLALLSDTHIPATPAVEARGNNMTAHLRQAVSEVIALKEKPAGVIVNGDCAYLQGLRDDYGNFASCVAPLTEAGLPLHLTMGNHDDRDMLYEVMAAAKPAQPLVASKHVTILETPRANWFLLDSMMEVNVVTGLLGAEQLRWLAAAIDARKDKPAIVMAHHTPQFTPPAEGKIWTGLKDTSALMDLLQSRKHVKAFVFGHSHNWKITEQNGLHLINLPAVAYVFSENIPLGWVLADVQEDGIQLQLNAIKKNDPKNGEVVNLKWRTA